MELSRVGVWSNVLGVLGSDEVRRALAFIEELGFREVWIPEGVGDKDVLVHAGELLAWSEGLTVATGIANIYARGAMTMANGARALWEAYPGRFLLGLGVSHRERIALRGETYGSPVTTMSGYLDAMGDAPYRSPRAAEETVVLAALGPRMLELARERTAGAHPYLFSVEHTARTRAALGPDALLLPCQTVVIETDPSEARRIARSYTQFFFALPNYRNNVLRQGYGEEELAEGGSDRVIDEIVAWGSVEDIATRVKEHLDAGADHVPVQLLTPPTNVEQSPVAGHFPYEAWRELASALVGL